MPSVHDQMTEAIMPKDVPWLRRILRRVPGPDADERDSEGMSLLHSAALRDSTEIIDILVGAKAVVDARHENGLTPLLVAAMDLKMESARALLDSAADIAVTVGSSQSVIHALLGAPSSVVATRGADAAGRFLAEQFGTR